MSVAADYSVRVKVANLDLGIWDRVSGGAVSQTSQKYNPGGRGAQIVLPGRKQTSDLTVSRIFRPGRDEIVQAQLIPLVGLAAVKVIKTFILPDGSAVANGTLTYSGSLDGVTPPEHNSDSEDISLLEILVAVAGPPAVS